MIKNITALLKSSQYKYCHWKSNEHLLPALTGDTDLDLLFDEKHKEEIKSLLEKSGFLSFEPAWFVRYPHIEDYLAIDPDSGKLLHLHCHFRLVLGEKRVKSYRLPWEEAILGRRLFDKTHQIYTSHPADEMLLLIVRSALKLPAKGCFPSRLEEEDVNREFVWLKERVTKEEILHLTQERIGLGIRELGAIYDHGFDRPRLNTFKKAIASFLSQSRRISKIQSLISQYSRYFFVRFAGLNKRLSLLNIPNHRTFRGEGLIVAITGADGSGKSTQTKRAYRALIKKIDTELIYMGSGNGSASWHRKGLQLSFSLIKKLRPTGSGSIVKKQGTKKAGPAKPALATIAMALSQAIEKRSRLNRAARLKQRGAIVLTDRYPQTEICGYNDGPLLGELSDSLWLKAFAKLERWLFAKTETIYPDLVIKLTGEVDTLHGRLNDGTPKETVEKKQKAIRTIRFHEKSLTQEIDATQSPDQVFIAIMATIGKEMRKRALDDNR